MTKTIKLFLFLPVFIMSCASIPEPIEHISIPGNLSGWKIGKKYLSQFSDSSTILYKLEHEKSENEQEWLKIVTIDYDSVVKMSIASIMNSKKFNLPILWNCKNFNLEIINIDQKSVLYERKLSNCDMHSDQHEIARFIQGEDGVHRITYSERVKELPAATRLDWIKKLTKVLVVKTIIRYED